MQNDHYVTREEYERLLALAQPKKSGVVQFVCGTLMIALAVVGGYFLLVIYLDAPPAPASAPTAAPARPTAPSSTFGGGSSSAPRPPSLPDCATVTDSRTACAGTVGEMPQGAEAQVEQAQPTGTPEPRWVTETCLTPPGARPCWLAEGEPWEAPQTVPETPIVLLPPTDTPPLVFADSACAAWHPPLAWPEGCGDE